MSAHAPSAKGWAQDMAAASVGGQDALIYPVCVQCKHLPKKKRPAWRVLSQPLADGLLLVSLAGVPSYAWRAALLPCLVVLMFALHAALQDVRLPTQDAVDPANVWGFASMDAHFWGRQQQAPEDTGNQQQHSPKQLQELLHKQQVRPVGSQPWHWVWAAL